MRIGAIEGGGTKFVCAIGDESGNIFERISIPTTTPTETLNKVIDFFKDKNITDIGFGSFGPIDLNEKSSSFGTILNTPKLSWKNFNVYKYLKDNLNSEIYMQTDVNVACLGEIYFGESKNYSNVLYITIGTGIGAGAYIDSRLINGVNHPEMGHIILKNNSSFTGICPYHKNCFEGLCSGPAIKAHYGVSAVELRDEKSWDEIGKLVALALYDYSAILNPERIIIGGGVSHRDDLFYYTKKHFKEINNNYIQNKYINDLDNYIVKTSLADNSAILGCIALVNVKKNRT